MFSLHILKVIEESQEIINILKHHKAHRRFLLLHKSNADETQTLKQCTKNYCSWSHYILGAITNWGKTKICNKHQTFEVIAWKSWMKMCSVQNLIQSNLSDSSSFNSSIRYFFVGLGRILIFCVHFCSSSSPLSNSSICHLFLPLEVFCSAHLSLEVSLLIWKQLVCVGIQTN